MVAGNSTGTFNYFQNNGGTFTELTGASNPFDGLAFDNNSSPLLIDINT